MTYTITARGALTALCWVIGFSLAFAGVFIDLYLGALANAFLMVAGVTTVKGCLNRHAADWITAYETGREVSKIRRLR